MGGRHVVLRTVAHERHEHARDQHERHDREHDRRDHFGPTPFSGQPPFGMCFSRHISVEPLNAVVGST